MLLVVVSIPDCYSALAISCVFVAKRATLKLYAPGSTLLEVPHVARHFDSQFQVHGRLTVDGVHSWLSTAALANVPAWLARSWSAQHFRQLVVRIRLQHYAHDARNPPR